MTSSTFTNQNKIMAILRYFLYFVKLSTLNNTLPKQIMQPIEVKFQTVFVENGIWLQNFMDFVKVEEIMKEFKIGAEWR